MSADNGIYIAEFNDGFRVAEFNCVDDINYLNEQGRLDEKNEFVHKVYKNSKVFKTYEEAWQEAMEIQYEIRYHTACGFEDTDYGIRELGHLGNWPGKT